MRGLRYCFTFILVCSIFGCGDNDTLGTGPSDDDGPNGTTPASVITLTSDPQLPTDGSQSATITAIVRDSDNAAISNQNVIFSVDTGTIISTSPITDSTGTALAELSIGSAATDKANRTITVTATAGSVSSSVTVEVQGTTFSVNGPSTLTLGDSADYTFSLLDAGGNGISGVTITPTSVNTLSAASLTTDNSGQAQVSLTASIAGMDTLSATALGDSAFTAITVSGDQFSFSTPTANQEIDLGASQAVTVQWLKSGVPESGRSIAFSSTRGTITGTNPATTDGSGNATVNISSLNAGAGLITATVIDGATSDRPTTTQQIEFVAITPDIIEIQSDRFTIGENEQATLTATVFDAARNRVKNVVVNFGLDDNSNGSLSVGTAITDSNGQATTVYQAGSVTSSTNDVIISADVLGFPGVTDSIGITVAQREVFVSLGFDNVLSDLPPDYAMSFSVRALDATGAALPDTDIQMSVLSVEYSKGAYALCPEESSFFGAVTAVCDDEDINNNGILDPGEDINSSGRIEAGGVAAISPGTVTTDATGRGLALLSYPQIYGGWLTVTVEARTGVQGTEFVDTKTFKLSVIASDLDAGQQPPGLLRDVDVADAVTAVCTDSMGMDTAFDFFGTLVVSPFGYADDCGTWLLDP